MHTAPPVSYLGTKLDQRYRLDHLVGEGATAWVFAAEDLRLERMVAVKVLKPWLAEENALERKRFVAEGRTLAKLVHPHVVLVHDAGETQAGVGFLVMELSDAGNLENELFRRGSLAPEECLRLLLPLVGALACAHDRGIVHRDIKPANIALVHDRRETKAKLLDFGIARRRDGGGSTDHALGTPSYMAPEQARGEALSPAADVWALGVVFYRCLSGRLPFEARSSLDTLLKLVHERAPRFAEACPNLGPHLAVALDRALEPDACQRYGDMRSFARALACACAQDSIQLPRRPEPVGLPDFERWLECADVVDTRPLLGSERAQIARSISSFLPARPVAWRATVGVTSLTAVLLAAAWVRPSARPVTREPAANSVSATVEAPSSARERDLESVSETALAPVPAAVMSQAREPALPTTPAPGAAQQPTSSAPRVKGKRRTARLRPALSAHASESESQSAAPAVPSDAKPALVTSWDW